jgi:hypothetical protein
MSPSQQKLLHDFSVTQQETGILELAFNVARNPKESDLKLACEVIRKMPIKGRRMFLKTAFLIATCENKCSSASNFLLRFLADVTELNFSEFCRVVGKNLQAPGDLSSIAWWKKIEATSRPNGSTKQKKAGASGGDANGRAKSHQSGGKNQMSLEEARIILKLDETATESDVASAFRKLASVHHPDRHAQSPIEEQRAAAKAFTQIRIAFETLSENQ